MAYEKKLKEWILADRFRLDALAMAASQDLPDWCLAAGFIRNLIWDKLHGFESATPLDDIDLIYFDPDDCSESRDRDIENQLRGASSFPWSVKNQARMHIRNNDQPYTSTEHAMSFWVEVETAVGATMDAEGAIVIVAPFGLKCLFSYTITPNPKRPKVREFEHRIRKKQWLQKWPKLVVDT